MNKSVLKGIKQSVRLIPVEYSIYYWLQMPNTGMLIQQLPQK